MRYAVLVLVWLATVGIATPVSCEEEELVAEVAGLRASVDELVGLLDRYVGYQKIELMLKRVDLKQRQLAPLEHELRNQKDDLDASNRELKDLEMYASQMEREIEEELQRGGGLHESEVRSLMKEVATRREDLDKRVADLERSVMGLENDVASRKRELLDLEDILADMLED